MATIITKTVKPTGGDYSTLISALADVPNEKVANIIDAEKSQSEECWPKSGCKVKESAQVALVYDHWEDDTTAITDWFISQAGPATELQWYLQITIDNNDEPSKPIIGYLKEVISY